MSFLSVTSAGYDNASLQNINPGLPAGATSAHILVMAIYSANTLAVAFTPPSGWTAVGTADSGGVSVIFTWWALGNVASLNFTSSSTGAAIAVCTAHSGRNTTTPITAFTTVPIVTGTTLDYSSVTAVAGDDLFSFGYQHQDRTAFGAVANGFTDRAELPPPTVNERAVASTKDAVTAGASGTWSRTGANFQTKGSITIALAAASGGGTAPGGFKKLLLAGVL